MGIHSFIVVVRSIVRGVAASSSRLHAWGFGETQIHLLFHGLCWILA